MGYKMMKLPIFTCSGPNPNDFNVIGISKAQTNINPTTIFFCRFISQMIFKIISSDFERFFLFFSSLKIIRIMTYSQNKLTPYTMDTLSCIRGFTSY